MKRKTIADYEKQLSEQSVVIERMMSKYHDDQKAIKITDDKHREALADFVKRLSEREKDIAALKSDLFLAHQKVASQGGYIARTLEDDNMRELGPVKPELPSNVSQAPQSRRMGVPMFNSFDNDYGGRNYSNRETSKPWHDR